MSGKYGPILEDFMDEALRIEKAAAELGLPLRIIGCLAFRLKSPEFADLHRAYIPDAACLSSDDQAARRDL